MNNSRDIEAEVRTRKPLLAAACMLVVYAGCSFPDYGFVPDGPAGTGGESGGSGSAGFAGATGGTGGTATGGTGGTATGGTGGTATGGTGGTSTGGTGGTATGGTGGTATGGTGGSGPPPDGLVIAEVYGGGGNTGALFTHDYVVLFNRGTEAAGLDGLVLQYASASGVFGTQYITLPAVTVLPGHYFLIQMSGGANGSPLPTPDFSATLAMGATSGKVALVPVASLLSGCGDAATPCSLANVLDFVGYGTSSQYEGTVHTANLSATKAAIRKGGGCTDTDDNGADFVTDAPTPRNTQSSPTTCS